MPDLTEIGNYKKWLQEVPVKGVINITSVFISWPSFHGPGMNKLLLLSLNFWPAEAQAENDSRIFFRRICSNFFCNH